MKKRIQFILQLAIIFTMLLVGGFLTLALTGCEEPVALSDYSAAEVSDTIDLDSERLAEQSYKNEKEKRAILQRVLYKEYKKLFDCKSDKQVIANVVLTLVKKHGKNYGTNNFEQLVKTDNSNVIKNNGFALFTYITELDINNKFEKGIGNWRVTEANSGGVLPNVIMCFNGIATDDKDRQIKENAYTKKRKDKDLPYDIKYSTALRLYNAKKYIEAQNEFQRVLDDFVGKEKENASLIAGIFYFRAKIEMELFTANPSTQVRKDVVARTKQYYNYALSLDSNIQVYVDALIKQYNIEDEDDYKRTASPPLPIQDKAFFTKKYDNALKLYKIKEYDKARVMFSSLLTDTALATYKALVSEKLYIVRISTIYLHQARMKLEQFAENLKTTEGGSYIIASAERDMENALAIDTNTGRLGIKRHIDALKEKYGLVKSTPIDSFETEYAKGIQLSQEQKYEKAIEVFQRLLSTVKDETKVAKIFMTIAKTMILHGMLEDNTPAILRYINTAVSWDSELLVEADKLKAKHSI